MMARLWALHLPSLSDHCVSIQKLRTVVLDYRELLGLSNMVAPQVAGLRPAQDFSCPDPGFTTYDTSSPT
jgi:hypothetical protein